MTKVSILVAVYNGEKYIRECLRSLICQTYRNIEIICIDDGSTDNSSAIIEEFTSCDSRIKHIKHSSNQGAAKARNTGFDNSSGDIIAYLDCDDLYAADTIEKLVSVFDSHDDADCVLFRCVYVGKDGSQSDYKGLKFNCLPGIDAFNESLTWHIHGVYAARAELFHKVGYDTTRRHFSDDNTTRIHYFMSRKVYQSDATYFYRYNPDSITNQISVSRMDFLAATQSMKNQLISLNCSDDIIRKYETERIKVLVDCYLFYYKYRKHLSKVDRDYCLHELKMGWDSIDPKLIGSEIPRKFGYNPYFGHWLFFRLQEEIYFFLKKITGRL